MAYPRKKATFVIESLEDEINYHLIKILCCQVSNETIEHWKEEIRDWLDRIGEIRVKPDMKTFSEKFYFNTLYDYPFGDTGDRNLRRHIRRLERKKYTILKDINHIEIMQKIKDFHIAFAKLAATGKADEHAVHKLVDNFK